MPETNANLKVDQQLDHRSSGISLRMAGRFNVEYNGKIMRPAFFYDGDSKEPLGLYLVPDDLSVYDITHHDSIPDVCYNKDADQMTIDFEEFIVSLGCIPVECEAGVIY